MLRNYGGTKRKHLGKNHVDFCRGAFNVSRYVFNLCATSEVGAILGEQVLQWKVAIFKPLCI